MLARHGEIGSAVGFASDEGEFGYGGFGVGEQQLRSVSNDAAPLLNNTGEEARDILEGQKWDVERVTGSNESCRFDGGVDVETTCEHFGLVADDANG